MLTEVGPSFHFTRSKWKLVMIMDDGSTSLDFFVIHLPLQNNAYSYISYFTYIYTLSLPYLKEKLTIWMKYVECYLTIGIACLVSLLQKYL